MLACVDMRENAYAHGNEGGLWHFEQSLIAAQMDFAIHDHRIDYGRHLDFQWNRFIAVFR
jgi:hypothetical protein